MTFDEANELIRTAWEGGYFTAEQREGSITMRRLVITPDSPYLPQYNEYIRRWAARIQELLQLPEPLLCYCLQPEEDADEVIDIELYWRDAPRLTERARRFFL